MKICRGDVVFVDLRGGVGVEKTKERPCVVVQNNRGNASSKFTVVVPVTDHAQFRGYPEHVEVPASELGNGGKLSVACCGELRQIDRTRINEAKGVWATLPPARMKQIDQALRAALALN
jgi:mRNA interferase MazF